MKNTANERDLHALISGKDQKIEMLEKAIQAGNKKYEILSKATNDAIWDWDIQTDCIEWNHGWHTIFGHTENNIPRQVWIDHLHPHDKREVEESFYKAIHDNQLNWSAIYRYRCSNGTYKYSYDRAYIVYENATPIRMIGAMQDIDERMLALHEIEKLSLVASKTENIVIITDENENIEWVNEGFVRRTGYSLQEVVGKTPRFLQGPETNREVLDRIKTSIGRGESCTEEVINYTKHGNPFWVKMNINPVFNEYNQLHKFVAVETDVTVHKEYEREIVAIALELSGLIENANAVIIGVDKNGLVNEWNKHATVALGYSKGELMGKSLTDFVVDPSGKNSMGRFIQYVLDGNTMEPQEFEIESQNGDRNILLLSATPRINSFGEMVGLIAVGQDITELTEYRLSLEKKVAERTRELNKLLEKEKEQTALKAQFASIVSHEFRTPLSSIKVSANHIRKFKARMTEAEIEAKLDVVLKQVEHMTYLLEDVLAIGRAEGTKITTVQKPVRLDEFFETLKEDMERMNKTHTIVLQFDLRESVVYTDPGLLRNIFVNLLSNAVKFSPKKTSVVVHISQSKKHWCVQVKDEGIGISADEARKIFEPFYRAPNASVIQGTGLGLSIVKKAVDLLDGKIEVTSNTGSGSVFCVTIPIPQ